MQVATALDAEQFVRSLDASRDTLGRPRMKLLEVLQRVSELTQQAPYAVIGALAQIPWARKSHTDALDLVLSTADPKATYERVLNRRSAEAWSLPGAPDRVHEADDVFEVYHLLHGGSVVDLLAFRDHAFNHEIIESARAIPDLGGVRFIRPELLLVTHLLRPGPTAALAAVELLIARRAKQDFDVEDARGWATRVGRAERLERVLVQASALDLI
jgi:hypothetical protein